MLFNAANFRRFNFAVIIVLLTSICILYFKPYSKYVAYSVDDGMQELSGNIDSIIDDIDTDELDLFLDETYISNGYYSFKDFAKDLINGNYINDYNSILLFINDLFLQNFNSYLRYLFLFIIISILFQLISNFCPNKFNDLKLCIKLIFCFILSFILLAIFKDYYLVISKFIDDSFSFANIIFPILLSLVTLSGSATTASVYSSFSVFLLETGLYIIKFILLPITLAIMILAIFSSVFSNKRFDRLIELFKMIFKYTIIIFIGLFGLLSSVNLVVSGASDGLNLKLTKFAIKNYVPVLGGYISDGFDFVHGCSVLIKNAFGLCGIFVLFFKLVQPLILSIILSLIFKIVSVVICYVGNNTFSDLFNNVSKSFSNFLTIILASFLIIFVFIFLLIISVGIV